MGRKLMRVPMNFDWPLKMVWKGYWNPYRALDCKPCGGRGYNPATQALCDAWYGPAGWQHELTQDEVDALLAHDRLWDLTQTWSRETGWQLRDPPVHPTAAEVNAWSRGLRGFKHDGINSGICLEVRAKRLGVWGLCPTCGGKGRLWPSEEFERLNEAWQPVDPPTGDGYQLWGTTGAGEPISPVFATLAALAAWCAQNATTFADHRATAAEWERMLGDDNVHHRDGNVVHI